MSETTLRQPNQTLLRLFQQHQVATGRTLEQLGEDFGYSATTICKYLNGKFTGNLEMLEAALEAGLRNFESRAVTAGVLFESHPEFQIRQYAKLLINRGWMGFAYGNSGVGKTCGANRLLLQDLSAVFITIVCYKRHREGLISLLWEQAGTGKAHTGKHEGKMDYLERIFTKSDRLLIVDQAHLLNKMGRQFFCDLNDRTGMAILFIGNPEALSEWKLLEQQYTRLAPSVKITMQSSGIREDIKSGCDAETSAEGMLKLHAPGGLDELRERALRIAKGCGHLRTLKVVLITTVKIQSATGCSWTDAFDAAEAMQAKHFDI